MAKKSGGSKDKGDARSAKTGRYVTKDYAVKHPSTTVIEKPKGSSRPKPSGGIVKKK